ACPAYPPPQARNHRQALDPQAAAHVSARPQVVQVVLWGEKRGPQRVAARPEALSMRAVPRRAEAAARRLWRASKSPPTFPPIRCWFTQVRKTIVSSSKRSGNSTSRRRRSVLTQPSPKSRSTIL